MKIYILKKLYKKQSFFSEKGSLILQLLLLISVTLSAHVVISSLLVETIRNRNFVNDRTSILKIRHTLMGAIGNHYSWSQTIQNQNFMMCAEIPLPAYCSLGENSPREIELYNAIGEKIHSNANTSGYTLDGVPCNDFGSGSCVIKFRVNWRANCTSGLCSHGQMKAEHFVSIEPEFSDHDRFLVSLNPRNYSLVEQSRLILTRQSAPSLNCGRIGGIFIGPMMQASTACGGFGQTCYADPQGCVSYQAFWGPRGQRGPQGAQGPRGPRGPIGPRGLSCSRCSCDDD